MANVQIVDELARLNVAHLADIPTAPEQVGAATAAQGAKADSAVQPAELAAVVDTIPTVPADIGAATAAQGVKADSALQLDDLTKAAVGLGNVDNTSDTAKPVSTAQQAALDGKVSVVTGKGLSTNDYTTAEQTKLAGVATGATANTTTTSLAEGTNLYFTTARVLSTILSGISLATSTAVTAADSLLTAIGKLQAQVSLKLAIIAAFTNTATSGTNASSTQDTAVTPTANTTQVAIGRRTQMTYNSSFNALAGGYLVAQQDVINTAGAGTHDKLVGKMVQLNLTGGNVAAAVGVEAVLSQIGATTTIAGAAGFLFANHRGVANIGNVGTLAAFSNQDPVALMVSAGPYVNADLREIAPSRSAGLIPGRYYSAPLKSMTTNIVATWVIYVTYVYVPRRCTLAALGFNVTVAGAGNGRLGLYKVANGILTTLVVQTGDISTATVGAKEGTVSTQIDSGVYALVAEFSGTPTIGWHEINTHDMIGASSVTGFSEQAYITPFAYGALPTFAANTIEPHLFFRVSA